MVLNYYTPGSQEYQKKAKLIEIQTKGYTDVQTEVDAKELIRFSFGREGIPLRYTKMGSTVRIFLA